MEESVKAALAKIALDALALAKETRQPVEVRLVAEADGSLLGELISVGLYVGDTPRYRIIDPTDRVSAVVRPT